MNTTTTTRTEADTATPATCQVTEGTVTGTDKACTAPGHHTLYAGRLYSVCCGHRVLLEAAGMTDGWAEL